jgi:hypothetical protein
MLARGSVRVRLEIYAQGYRKVAALRNPGSN